ncbi:MAG TPA: hypothetical protein VGM82_24770 [Gemmatimonadaceae bacterium]|jgi:hypothetical protein
MPSRAPAPRSVDDLASAKDLRAEVCAKLIEQPINEPALRAAVWNFVGNERRTNVPAEEVIRRLMVLIEDARLRSAGVHQALQRQLVRWCVEEYFGQFRGDPGRQMVRRSEDIAAPTS